MFKVLWNYGLVVPALFNVFFILSSDAMAEAPPSAIASETLNLSESNSATQAESNQIANVEVIETPDYLLSQTENLFSQENLTDEENSLEQVTSVSELSDVQPTDWAFQALQSLVVCQGNFARLNARI
ncbi:hypothetical protein [Anabaena subtropica]|uniref:hypothetical protein n=1 Tax=Anabaena subtropica TaxID=425380 RepID=UPI001F556817|nr:hypothetical protein [Anabaena subtropica]